jgi:hypothetical protein
MRITLGVAGSAAGLAASVLLLSGCGLRDDWVHPQYASHSNQYYADRQDCMRASYKGPSGFGGEMYSRERFSVCMQARGWRNP